MSAMPEKLLPYQRNDMIYYFFRLVKSMCGMLYYDVITTCHKG